MLVIKMLKNVEALAKTNGRFLYQKLENELISGQLQWSQVAKKIGCSKGNLSNILSKLKNGKISLYNLTLICSVFDLKLSDLFNNRRGKGEHESIAHLVNMTTERFETGDIVKLKDILAPVWQEMNNQQKRSMGKRFYRDVVEGHYPSIIFWEKGSDNQARYKIANPLE